MTRLSEVTKPVFSRKELYPVSAPLRSGKLSTSTANRDSGYNKRIERFLPKDLALSVSADPETGTVNAFLHGCSGDQVDDIEHWLYRCQELVVHPLLMHFLLAEIQLERHAGVLREYRRRFRKTYEKIARSANALVDAGRPQAITMGGSETQQDLEPGQYSEQIFDHFRKISDLRKRMISYKSTLKVIGDSLDDLANLSNRQREAYAKSASHRISKRLDDIVTEFDSMITDADIMVEGASLLLTSVSDRPFLRLSLLILFRCGVWCLRKMLTSIKTLHKAPLS